MQFRIKNIDKDVDLNKFDESQQEAIKSEDGEIVIRAFAGSGKTATLIASIINHRYNYLADRICAITYTRAAAAEMKNRLQEAGIYDVEVYTIHSWSLMLLRDFSIKYDFEIKVLREKEIKYILKEIVSEYVKKSRVKYVNIDILYTYVTGSKRMDIDDNYRRTLNALDNRYIKYKRDYGLYDFTDYPLYLHNVLEAYDETINTVDALFIDEFQDVDPIQSEIFKKVKASKKFYIGDPQQSIYVFRGADGEIFEKLYNFTHYDLKYNYRSYQEIIDYASYTYMILESILNEGSNCYISSVVESIPSKIICDRGYGGKVIVVNPYSQAFEVSSVNGTQQLYNTETILEEFLRKNPMILCRTNREVKMIKDISMSYNVDTIHQAKGLEYDDVVVIDSTIKDIEDLNVAYVALTRAKNNVLVINWNQFENFLLRRKKNDRFNK